MQTPPLPHGRTEPGKPSHVVPRGLSAREAAALSGFPSPSPGSAQALVTFSLLDVSHHIYQAPGEPTPAAVFVSVQPLSREADLPSSLPFM